MNDKSKKLKFHYNYLSAGFIYIWSLAFLFFTPGIANPASRIFPYIVSIFAIVLATALVIQTYFATEEKQEKLDFSGTSLALIMAAILVIYAGAIKYIGFYISTPIYLYLSMLQLGQKNKKAMIIVSIATPIIVYFAFDILLGMQIPVGDLITYYFG